MRIRRRSHEPEPAPPEPPPPAPPAAGDAAAAVETDVAKRVLAHAARPEEKLERLLAERSRELEDQAARFELAMEDIERREGLLRDMRASVERMLRHGADDLTAREAELAALDRDVTERHAQLSAGEVDLERRRSELGAVELKREAVEQRERALAAREEELEARESGRLTELAQGQKHDLRADEPDVGQDVALFFVPGSAYSLVEVESKRLRKGDVVDVEGVSYVVTRLGSAPLPGDGRGCAYLERVPPGSSASAGSS
jgi:hypothetical protein